MRRGRTGEEAALRGGAEGGVPVLLASSTGLGSKPSAAAWTTRSRPPSSRAARSTSAAAARPVAGVAVTPAGRQDAKPFRLEAGSDSSADASRPTGDECCPGVGHAGNHGSPMAAMRSGAAYERQRTQTGASSYVDSRSSALWAEVDGKAGISDLGFQPGGDQAPRAQARAPRDGRHLPRLDRGALQALPGLRGEAERDSYEAGRSRPRHGENQVYSEIRALKVDLAAIGGVKNHEIYFEHLAAAGSNPVGAIGELIERDFGSADDWRADLRATGMAGRGWAWTAYDFDEQRLFNYVVRRTRSDLERGAIVALDVYEHAYFLDYQTDRASYIEAFFQEPRLDVVSGWVDAYAIQS